MVVDGIYYALGLSAAGGVITWIAGAWFALPLFLLAVFCLYFFRDPEREIPPGPVAVSPADGKVVAVQPDGAGHNRVSIFLNIFDVHVNRTPIAGTIARVDYRKGQFLVASKEAASAQNEQNTVTAVQGQRRAGSEDDVLRRDDGSGRGGAREEGDTHADGGRRLAARVLRRLDRQKAVADDGQRDVLLAGTRRELIEEAGSRQRGERPRLRRLEDDDPDVVRIGQDESVEGGRLRRAVAIATRARVSSGPAAAEAARAERDLATGIVYTNASTISIPRGRSSLAAAAISGRCRYLNITTRSYCPSASGIPAVRSCRKVRIVTALRAARS